MQATTTLSFRALANKIHGPLPLSKRESQQLLTLLTSSFQHQLDRYHPAGEEAEIKAPSLRPTPVQLPHPIGLNGNQPSLSSRTYTSDHLLSILDHPLLAKKPRSASFSKRQAPPASRTTDAVGVNPLPWLEEKIANGTVSIADVARCLNTISGKSFIEIPSEASRQWLKELGAATKIISWLRVGGQVSEKNLLQNKIVCSQLAKLLVIEERQDLIWSFIGEATPNNILGYALSTEARLNGTEAAMKTYNKLQAAFPALASTDYSWPIIAKLVRTPHAIAREVYDRFADSMNNSKNSTFHKAVLSLHHPETPSTDRALAFVRDLSSPLNMDQYISTRMERRVLVHTLLKLASTLLEREDNVNAQMVLGFAQGNFSVELGVEAPKSTAAETAIPELSEAELENVERIGLLAL